MTIERGATTVDEPSEIEASHNILTYFKEFDGWQETLSSYALSQANSAFAIDDPKMPTFPVSQYAYSQIMGAFGVLEALKSMMIKEDGETPQITAGPYGIYTLVRNAIDSAALALWLLEPENSKLRVKRRLKAQMDEISNTAKFRDEAGIPSREWAKEYRLRMQQVAEQAEVGAGEISKWRLPSMTRILNDIERRSEPEPGLSWLAAWQLCSGHAHGKQWAILMSNELSELPGTATDIGATYWNTASYAHIDLVLHAARNLIRTVCFRYTALAKDRAHPVAYGRTLPTMCFLPVSESLEECSG